VTQTVLHVDFDNVPVVWFERDSCVCVCVCVCVVLKTSLHYWQWAFFLSAKFNQNIANVAAPLLQIIVIVFIILLEVREGSWLFKRIWNWKGMFERCFFCAVFCLFNKKHNETQCWLFYLYIISLYTLWHKVSLSLSDHLDLVIWEKYVICRSVIHYNVVLKSLRVIRFL